jgi:DNA-binding response OmpR family regulator
VPTVLLVESRRDDRSMYTEYLRLRGFTVLEADTTDEALFHAVQSDVIVTGVRVNGSFDGLELVRKLRADASTQSKPIIVLTAWAFEPSRQLALAAGCDIFLTKPCLPEMLATESRRALRLRSRAKKR